MQWKRCYCVLFLNSARCGPSSVLPSPPRGFGEGEWGGLSETPEMHGEQPEHANNHSSLCSYSFTFLDYFSLFLNLLLTLFSTFFFWRRCILNRERCVIHEYRPLFLIHTL